LTVTDEILEIYARRGIGAYFGESVSMTEHALQAAYFARAAAAPPPLIVAALLHDVGHLVVDVPDDLADWI
jgi:predicted HD phosphohydrolase